MYKHLRINVHKTIWQYFNHHIFNMLFICHSQSNKLNRFLKFSGQHICKLRPTEAPTFYFVPDSDQHPRNFDGKLKVDVSIVKPLSEQQTGENKSPPALGSVANGAQHSHAEASKESYDIYISVQEKGTHETMGVLVIMY